MLNNYGRLITVNMLMLIQYSWALILKPH